MISYFMVLLGHDFVTFLQQIQLTARHSCLLESSNAVKVALLSFLVVQKNVDENWEAALEYNPEAFARVV